MPLLFIAGFAFADDDGETMTSGLADKQFETSRHLTFQKAHKTSEQDKCLGLDGVYLEVNDQLHSCYGGVENIHLFENRLDISLTEKAATAMQLPIQFSVGLVPNLPALIPFTNMLSKMQLPIRKDSASVV
jgi:hypothetical protein